VGAESESGIFLEELEKFRPYENRLQASFSLSRSLLSEIQKVLADIVNHPGFKSKLQRKEKVANASRTVESLREKLCDSGPALIKNIRELSSFVANVDHEVQQLRQAVAEYLNSRRMEGRRLLEES